MSVIPHAVVVPSVDEPLNSLVAVAASVEAHVANLEEQVRDRDERLRFADAEFNRGYQRTKRAYGWIKKIRRSHRGESHARTSKIINTALADLQQMLPVLKYCR